MPETTCQYPDFAAVSGYTYGCRCERCRAGHRASNRQARLMVCKVQDCDGRRVKGRLWCEAHLPRCNMPDCDKPRRPVQAARYCDEHATMRNGVPVLDRHTPRPCWVCGVECIARGTRPLCKAHKHLSDILYVWATHHVSHEQIVAWLDDPKCWVCGGSLAWRFLPTKATGRRGVHVDHDHACCKGDKSCGQCVRGLTHAACNVGIGQLDAFIALVGLERVRQLLVR